MWDGINRRKFPRAHYRCFISIRSREKPKKFSSYTENIGAGGICVILEEDMDLFQGVNLEIDLKNGIPSDVKCSGTVVWVVKKHDIKHGSVTQYDIGIEFVDITGEDKKRILKIVDQQLKEEKG